MARGAKRKWIIARASDEDHALARELFLDAPAITIVKDWFSFCRENVEAQGSRSQMMRLYSAQQLRTGTMASSVQSRIESLGRISAHPEHEEQTLDSFRAAMLKATLAKLVAKERGAGKPLVLLADLVRPLVPTATKVRHRRYQALWWSLLVTGSRPCHIKHAGISTHPTVMRVKWGSRKARSKALQRPLDYQLAWSCDVDPVIRSEVLNCKAIGTISKSGKSNVAACINSWLLKWMRKHHPECRQKLTSTLPRVYLDNILRAQLENGFLSEHNYVMLMDHTVRTSDEHYCGLITQSE